MNNAHLRHQSKRVIIIVAKVILVIGLLEFGLRLDFVKRITPQMSDTITNDGTYTIVCIGNSLLRGGTNRPSVPMQLEEILNTRNTGIKFRVINRSIGALRSDQVVERLGQELDIYKPNMVVLLMGIEIGANNSLRERNWSLMSRSRLTQLIAAIYIRWKEDSRILKWANTWRIIPFFRYSVGTMFGSREIGEYIPFVKGSHRSLYTYILGIPATLANPLASLYVVPPFNYYERTCFRSPVSPAAVAASIVTGKALLLSCSGDELFRLGLDCLQRRKPFAAIEYLQLSLQKNAVDMRACSTLGRILCGMNRWYDAQAILSRRITLSPQFVMSYLQLGDAYSKTGDREKAKITYREVFDRFPDNVIAAMRLVLLYREYNDVENLNELYRRIVLMPVPCRDRLYPVEAYISCENGEYQKAYEICRKGVERDPRSSMGFALLISLVKNQRNNYQEAKELLSKACAQDLELRGYGGIWLSEFALEMGEFQKAEMLLKKIIETNPGGDPWGYMFYADGCRMQGRFAEAEQIVRQGIARNPFSALMPLQLGRIFRDMGREDAAERAFARAVRNAPDNDDTRREYRNFSDSRRRIHRRISEIEHEPESADKYIELGKVYAAEKWYWHAIRMFQTAIEKATDNIEAYENLVLAYKEQYNYAAALDTMNEAINHIPDNADLYVLQGGLYHLLGDDVKAEQSLLHASRLAPHHGGMHYILSTIYGETGRYQLQKQAVEEIRRYPCPEEKYELILRLMGLHAIEGMKADSGDIYYSPAIIRNFHAVKRILDERKIRLVCAQYPLRKTKPLADLFAGQPDVIIVDNDRSFREALKASSYRDYFIDDIYGDFGHGTKKGNRLMAQNMADAILRDLIEHRSGSGQTEDAFTPSPPSRARGQ